MNISRVAMLLVAAGLGSGPALTARAQDKTVYRAPGADQKVLLREPLHGVPGHQVTIIRATVPPNWIGGKHYHTGPVYVYVLKGTFAVDEQGKERRVFAAGEVYNEPIGTPMQARNPNESSPLEILLVQIGRQGEPLMINAE